MERSFGEFKPISISTPLADAELYTYGAHLTRWTPRGQQPVLYLSPQSHFKQGTAIRGGVPIIFPWFGPRSDGKEGPMHGFARISEWTTDGPRTQADGMVQILLNLSPSDATRALLDIDFALQFRVTIGAELQMELETYNLGQTPFKYEEALHTYLEVGAVGQVSVTGLEQTDYLDKTDNYARKAQGLEPIRFDRHTDRVYVNTQATCTVHDPSWARRIVVEKSGSNTTVVWNPGWDTTASMSDMTPESWKQMVCVETANVGENAITLAPGALHKMSATLRIES